MRERTKDCFNCNKQEEAFYRCRYEDQRDWVFLCDPCLQVIKKTYSETYQLKVRENITQKSSQILKGTIVQSEKHDVEKDQVIVTVVTGVVSVETSKKLKQLM